MDEKRAFLRHTLATLAYRANRALENSPEEFGAFSEAGRTPGQILAHMGDLFDWAISTARGHVEWHDSQPLPWPEEQKRFFTTLAAFDAILASPERIAGSLEELFQGPIADAFAHTGQIAMLRRLAGCRIMGENYYKAKIATGQVGPDQPAAVVQF